MTTSTPTETEVDVLDDAPSDRLTLQSGMEVRVQRVRMRQLIRLAKVVNRGVDIETVREDFDPDNPLTLLPIVIQALGEAENETIAFIQSLVVPADHNERPRTNADRAKNDKAIDEMVFELTNPDIEDVLDIVSTAYQIERPYFEALGKKFSVLFDLESKTTK